MKVLVVSFKIWGCFSTPKHLLVYGLESASVHLASTPPSVYNPRHTSIPLQVCNPPQCVINTVQAHLSKCTACKHPSRSMQFTQCKHLCNIKHPSTSMKFTQYKHPLVSMYLHYTSIPNKHTQIISHEHELTVCICLNADTINICTMFSDPSRLVS